MAIPTMREIDDANHPFEPSHGTILQGKDGTMGEFTVDSSAVEGFERAVEEGRDAMVNVLRHQAIRILMIGAEMAPWAKVGGLGDVLSSLPPALAQAGAEVVVAMPFYERLREPLGLGKLLHKRPFRMAWEGRSFSLFLRSCRHPAGFTLLLVECDELYKREGIYHRPGSHREYADNLVRWGALCRGALLGAHLLGGEWDIVHAHDMHGALALPMLREMHGATPLANAATALSIHNLAYQGTFPLTVVPQLGLSNEKAYPFGPYEFYGHFNCLKAGLEFADGIHTVSPSYAKEIVEKKEFGHGLGGVLKHRSESLIGILNGIDTEFWNPEIDPWIAARYSNDNLRGKRQCRQKLVELCEWSEDSKRPILGMVSRLTPQKGIDLLEQAISELGPKGPRFVLLGNGDKDLEMRLQRLAKLWPESVYVRIEFDEVFAHQIQAGADMLLMPSRFEPCGLAQMFAMRYGTIPIARETGGLADTIIPFQVGFDHATGFLFAKDNVEDFVDAIRQACAVWTHKKNWRRLVRNAMSIDFSWTRAAQEYLQWYRSLLEERNGSQIP